MYKVYINVIHMKRKILGCYELPEQLISHD
jgi:hypothetical protein